MPPREHKEPPAGPPEPRTPLEGAIRGLLASGMHDAAATALIENLGPSVLGYLGALHGEDDAADVFSLWAEDVWNGLPAFRFEGALRSWAFRVAWNASARFRRDGWRLRRERLPTTAASRLAGSVVQGSRGAPGDDRLDELRRDLDPEDHTLLVLRLDREMTWEEIAQVLSSEDRSIRPAALRKRFERLKERLARKARQQGLLP